MKREIRKNLIVYGLLMAFALIGMYYGHHLIATQPAIRVWNTLDILWLLVAIPFLFFQQEAGFPDFLHTEIKARQRFLVPLAIGVVFGIFDIAVWKVLIHPEPYGELPPFLQPFPYSVFLYISGALEIEVFYRLIPLTVICYLGNRFLKSKNADSLFYTAALLTSLREPLEQMPDGAWWLVAYSLITGLLMNFLQAVYFRKAGFLASLSMRIGHYIFWHILLGIFVEYVELAN